MPRFPRGRPGLPRLVDTARELSKVLAAAGYTPQGLSAAMQPVTTGAPPTTAVDRVTPYYYDAAVLARRLGYEEYPRRAFLDDYLQITRRARRAMERIFQEELAG